MSIVVASLVKNEMDRFFPAALRTWATFADTIVVLDDGSTDGSREFAKEFGAETFSREGAKAWGDETSAREALFELAWSHARVDDVIFWLDADMTPASDPRTFLSTDVDSFAFHLYDLWTPTEFRSDEWWRGHEVPRIWAIRKRSRDAGGVWSGRGIHSGHLPEMDFGRVAFAPTRLGLLHYAYVDEALREEKYVRYASVASQLTPFEIAHARTILDYDPPLVRLPFDPELTLV